MSAALPGAAVFIETYGCQMNVLDSELIGATLKDNGFGLTADETQADIVLLNTCSVRELAEQKVRSHLGRLGMMKHHQRPGLIIGVVGCMAERESESLSRRMPYIDIFCGPARLHLLPALVRNAMANRGLQVEIDCYRQHRQPSADETAWETFDSATRLLASNRQAFVRITRGCNKMCSFCVVPFTRGPELHRSPKHIEQDVRRLVETGVVEITLLGQTVNHYQHKANGRHTRFADLLWRIHEAFPSLPRLRFVTSYPRDFDEATLEVMAAAPRICRYLHLPAQSGSNTILQAMNRGYTSEAYLDLLARARAKMPDICFAGDMIVGFPGESDADQNASIELLHQARYKNCFVFKYSPRSGTPAFTRYADDVSEEIKRQRNIELLEVQAEISLSNNQSRLGHQLEILVEGHSKLDALRSEDALTLAKLTKPTDDDRSVRLIGRTRGDEIVAFDGHKGLVGRIVWVTAVGASALTIRAVLKPNEVGTQL